MEAPRDKTEKDFDVVLLGASGTVGNVMAKYLMENGQGLKWAIAGRKASGSLRNVALACHSAASLLNVDCSDAASVHAMAARARVVLTAVGPYAVHGEAVVAACIEQRAHYVDITGELWWVAQMRDKYGPAAEAAGVTLCSFAGYDCVPFEMGVRRVASLLQSKHQTALVAAETLTTLTGGGFPLGTMMTLLGVASAGPMITSIRSLRYVPASERLSMLRDVALWALPGFSAQLRGWTLGEGMGVPATAVVHASAPCLGYPKLRYQARLERGGPVAIPGCSSASASGVLGALLRVLTLGGLVPIVLLYLLAAPLLPIGLVVVGLLAWCPPLVKAVEKNVLPLVATAGSPTERVIMKTRGTGESGAVVHATMDFPGDAGVYCTTLCACESTLALLDIVRGRETNGGQPLPRGFTTPAAALGSVLEERLRRAGVRFAG